MRVGTREFYWWLRALVALLEDLSSVPTINMVAYDHV